MQKSKMNFFNIPLITVNYVVKQLLQLNTNKAKGTDDISPYFLKLAAYIIVARGGGFSSKPETHFAVNIFIEDLVTIKFPIVGSSHAKPRTREKKLKPKILQNNR